MSGRHELRRHLFRADLLGHRGGRVKSAHRGLGDWQTMMADLVIAALGMAGHPRRPRGVIHHSDKGSQYAGLAFGKCCKKLCVRPSMGSVGVTYDSATADSCFAGLGCELLFRRTIKTKTEARMALFTWIDASYNPRRRHSSLGCISPVKRKRWQLHAAYSQRDEPDFPLSASAWQQRRRWRIGSHLTTSLWLENQLPTCPTVRDNSRDQFNLSQSTTNTTSHRRTSWNTGVGEGNALPG